MYTDWYGPKYKDGRYYKYMTKKGEKHILDSDEKEGLESGNPGTLHDHFFTKNGQWYVQTKIDNADIFSNHLFERIAPGIEGVEQAESSEYLDYLFDELQDLSDC